MLTINARQMAVFAAEARRRFVAKMRDHATSMFPQRTKQLGSDRLDQLIEDGIAAASRYGLITEQDVALFIDLMIGLAPDFDAAPECAWVRPFLEGDSPARMELLYASAQRRLSPADLNNLDERFAACLTR